MNPKAPLDKIPDYLIQIYLVFAVHVIRSQEGNPNESEAYEPYGWNQTVPYLTQAEQNFRSIHSLVLREISAFFL